MLLPPYKDAVRALGLPDVGDELPTPVRCPRCGLDARIVGQLEPRAPSLFYCLDCQASGDVVDYVRFARGGTHRDAFIFLHAITGWPYEESSWGEYATARGPLERAKTIWRELTEANSHDTLLEELLTTYLKVPEQGMYGGRWPEISRALVAAAAQANQFLRYVLSDDLDGGHRQPLLVFPLQTIPGRIVGFCVAGGRHKKRLHYVPLSLIQKGSVAIREGGLYYHPEVPRAARSTSGVIVAYPNVLWAAVAQFWHLLSNTKPLPIVAWANPIWGKEGRGHVPLRWAGYSARMVWDMFDRTRLVLWLPQFSREGLWHLLRVKCRVSLLEVLGDPLDFVGARALGSSPEDVVRRIAEQAIPWQEAGRRLLFGRRDTDVERIVADALLHGIPPEDLLSCCETRRQEQIVLRMLERKGAGHRTDLFSGTVTETETGYYLERNRKYPPILLSDARIHVHRIVRGRRTAYQGVVLYNNAVLPFYDYEEVENDTARWLLHHCLRHGQRPPRVDPSFPRLLFVAMRLHPPSQIDDYTRVGWDRRKRAMILPRFVLERAGIVDTRLWELGHCLVPGHPAWRIPPPRDLAPHEVQPPGDSACGEIYFACIVGILASILSPLKKRAPAYSLALHGPGAVNVGTALARELGCFPEKDTADALLALVGHCWPIFLPSWAEEKDMDAIFASLVAKDQGFIVDSTYSAQKKLRTHLPRTLVVDGPEDVLVSERSFAYAPALVSAYLRHLSTRNWGFVANPLYPTWGLILRDFADFLGRCGGPGEMVLQASRRIFFGTKMRRLR